MEQQTLLAICCFLLCSKDIFVSALTVTTADEVIGVNGRSATFRISYELLSGETFRLVKFVKGSDDVFEAPYYIPGSSPDDDGIFYTAYASRASTDYTYGKNNFSITLSQLTTADEGQYTVGVSIEEGVTETSTINLVVDYTTTPTGSGEGGDTVKPTENGKGGDTVKPTGNGEGGDTIKPTGSEEGRDTVKPTENGKGGDTVKPTGNGEGGVSAGCHDIPNKIVLGAALVVMAMISTII